MMRNLLPLLIDDSCIVYPLIANIALGLVIAWATRHNSRVNGVRLVLLALSSTACVKAETTDNANNASLTPPPNGPCCDQAHCVSWGEFFLFLLQRLYQVYLILNSSNPESQEKQPNEKTQCCNSLGYPH